MGREKQEQTTKIKNFDSSKPTQQLFSLPNPCAPGSHSSSSSSLFRMCFHRKLFSSCLISLLRTFAASEKMASSHKPGAGFLLLICKLLS
jgi:hypothetical protein